MSSHAFGKYFLWPILKPDTKSTVFGKGVLAALTADGNASV